MDTLFLILRVALSLAAVLLVIWFIQKRISKGSGRLRTQKAITVIGRQAVGSKASVAVVEIDGTRFVLGVTDHAVNVLHAMGTQTVESTSDAFSRVLAEAAGSLDLGEPREQRAGLSAEAAASPRGPLAGSILSADTWKRAFASITS